MRTYKFQYGDVEVKSAKVRKDTSDRAIVARIKEFKDMFPDDPRSMPDRYRKEVRRLRNQLKIKENPLFDATVSLKKCKFKMEFPSFVYPDNKVELIKVFKELINEATRAYRQRLKTVGVARKQVLGDKYVFEGVGSPESGRVFSKPGQVFEKYVQKKVKDLYADKLPVLPSKYIGLELEFCAPITETDFALKLFKAGLQKFVQLKHDGSLRPHEGETGYELAILLPEMSYKKDLKRVADVLKSINAIAVDRRCGLHVHLDMRRRNKDVVFSNLVACQSVLLAVVDPRRVDNEFCRLVQSKRFPTKFKGDRQERYKTINAAAYYRYKTLEVRMHQGSVDFVEMVNWMDLLIKIANHKKKIKNNISELPILRKRFKLKKKIYSNLIDKSCYWQINHGEQRRLNRVDELATHVAIAAQDFIGEPAFVLNVTDGQTYQGNVTFAPAHGPQPQQPAPNNEGLDDAEIRPVRRR